MENPRIGITIEGRTYSVCASSAEAIGNIPAADRSHLINLLEVVKRQHGLSPAPIPAAPEISPFPSSPPPAARPVPARSPASVAAAPAGRLGSGDIDALMTRLAAEERRGAKPGLTRARIYQVMGGVLLLIVLIVAFI